MASKAHKLTHGGGRRAPTTPDGAFADDLRALRVHTQIEQSRRQNSRTTPTPLAK